MGSSVELSAVLTPSEIDEISCRREHTKDSAQGEQGADKAVPQSLFSYGNRRSGGWSGLGDSCDSPALSGGNDVSCCGGGNRFRVTAGFRFPLTLLGGCGTKRNITSPNFDLEKTSSQIQKSG